MKPEEVVEFSEALARIAASGGGAKALAAHLAKFAGGGVLLEDAHWRALATAGAGEIPASARGIVESTSPGRAQRVTAGDSNLGWLSLAGDAPNADLLLRLTAAAIGLELSRNGAMTRERKGGFWEALLDGAFHDASAVRDEASARGIALAAQYLAVALESDDFSGLRALATQAFPAAGTDLGLVERGPLLLLFVPAARALDASNAKTAASLLPKSASRRKPPLRISGGIGTTETPLAIRTSVESAEAALAIGRRIYGGGHVAAYEELGAYRLLYEGADPDRLRHFASETLAPLRSYDEKHQTELERTLKRYFQSGQNVKTAAAELSVHRHTVFYRLRQIGEISARSFDSPHDQLTLRLAVAIDELYNSK
ncbi:MAG TPA: helix-turn-helix domain-containing protein [Candidatus Cybelea sp.]|nr:helix-turn-helix domain-containing protein [Candidatus Cybelea sp.]